MSKFCITNTFFFVGSAWEFNNNYKTQKNETKNKENDSK